MWYKRRYFGKSLPLDSELQRVPELMSVWIWASLCSVSDWWALSDPVLAVWCYWSCFHWLYLDRGLLLCRILIRTLQSLSKAWVRLESLAQWISRRHLRSNVHHRQVWSYPRNKHLRLLLSCAWSVVLLDVPDKNQSNLPPLLSVYCSCVFFSGHLYTPRLSLPLFVVFLLFSGGWL